MKKDKVVFILGPTAAGKTAFAIKLAKSISGEIISSDSMQAYRQMDIISQKPSRSEREEIPCHLVDILDPNEEYSAAEFVRRAGPIIDRIIKDEKTPLVVGGSGLYAKALVDGLFLSPPKDIEYRRRLELEAKESGAAHLHKRLKAIDAQAASAIHPNDLRRIIRALEVFRLTGVTISEQKKRAKGIKERWGIMMYGLLRPRDILYKRIEERVDRMFEQGLVREVGLVRKKRPGLTARAALGYKEVLGYIDKKYTLEEAKELLKKNTRHFLKKQMTFFKADKRMKWLDLEEMPEETALDLIIEESGWRKR